MYRIRRPFADEAMKISALAFRSKSHWGYSDAQLAIFRRELSLSSEQLSASHAHVLASEDDIVGFYTLQVVDPLSIELQHLFIDPTKLRQGCGSLLFKHAVAQARRLGAERVIVQSDPNAAGFYAALGAKHESDIPSSIPGRSIPLFSVDVSIW